MKIAELPQREALGFRRAACSKLPCPCPRPCSAGRIHGHSQKNNSTLEAAFPPFLGDLTQKPSPDGSYRLPPVHSPGAAAEL